MDDIRKGVCPLCRHNEIVETHAGVATDGPRLEPLCAHITIVPGFFGTYAGFRVLMYVCRACGYSQSFTEKPGDIPLDDDSKTRLIRGPAPAGPFR